MSRMIKPLFEHCYNMTQVGNPYSNSQEPRHGIYSFEEYMHLYCGQHNLYHVYLAAYAIGKKIPGVWKAAVSNNRFKKNRYSDSKMKSASPREIMLLEVNTVLSRLPLAVRVELIVDDTKFVEDTFPKARKKGADKEEHGPWTIVRLANEIRRVDVSVHLPDTDYQREICEDLRISARDKWKSLYSHRYDYIE